MLCSKTGSFIVGLRATAEYSEYFTHAFPVRNAKYERFLIPGRFKRTFAVVLSQTHEFNVLLFSVLFWMKFPKIIFVERNKHGNLFVLF